MQVPPEITIKDVEATPELDKLLQQQIARLERISTHITAFMSPLKKNKDGIRKATHTVYCWISGYRLIINWWSNANPYSMLTISRKRTLNPEKRQGNMRR